MLFDDLHILYELAEMGNCSGIDRWLSRLVSKNTKFLPFIHKVTRLAKQFEHDEICKLIETQIK
jgi:hypothetical protein